MRRTVAALLLTCALPGVAVAEEVEAEPVPARPAPKLVRPDVSMTPAIIATAATGALLAVTVLTVVKHNAAIDASLDPMRESHKVWDSDPNVDDAIRWRNIGLATGVLTLIGAGVSGYLWSRGEPAPTVDIEPQNDSFRISMARRF